MAEHAESEKASKQARLEQDSLREKEKVELLMGKAVVALAEQVQQGTEELYRLSHGDNRA